MKNEEADNIIEDSTQYIDPSDTVWLEEELERMSKEVCQPGAFITKSVKGREKGDPNVNEEILESIEEIKKKVNQCLLCLGFLIGFVVMSTLA